MLENLREVLPILQRDIRFGYHVEAHGYQYDADEVAAKIRSKKGSEWNDARINAQQFIECGNDHDGDTGHHGLRR